MARILEDDELSEHRENIEEAKERLRGLRDSHSPDEAVELPKAPN